MGGLWHIVLTLLSLAAPAAAGSGGGCERSTSVLLFGDSLTEGLLGNGCFRRAHANPPPTPYRDKRGDVRARPAPSAKTFDKRACFYPYALRLGERYAEENVTVAFEFVTSPPAEVPAGSRAAAPCDAAHRERVTLVEAGVSGERVDHMVPRLRALLASRCFDAVVVLAGTNNLGGDAAASILDHVAQLRAAVARACPGARVLSVTLPELARDRWPGPAKTRVAVNAKLPGRDRVDLDALTCRTCGRGDRDGLWDEDGIHLARPGYDAFGDAVFAALKRPGDGNADGAVATPHIDALAKEGVTLSRYYSAFSCTPARGALLTGLSPHRLGLQHGQVFPEQPWGLPSKFSILPQHLAKLGYRSHLVGKWHLGHFSAERLPTARGFDSFFGGLDGAQYYATHIDAMDCKLPGDVLYRGFEVGDYDSLKAVTAEHGCYFDLRENNDRVEDLFGSYSTQLFGRKAEELIDAHSKRADAAEKPLFLLLSFNAVHAPVWAPEDTYETHRPGAPGAARSLPTRAASPRRGARRPGSAAAGAPRRRGRRSGP